MQQDQTTPDHQHPDYDLHIPRSLTYPVPVAAISVLIGAVLFVLMRENPVVAGVLGGLSILIGGIYAGFCALVKRVTNLERRFQARDRLLDQIPWQGDETLLDVGCGNGILTLGAARHLTTGKAIGIDIWTEGSGDCSLQAFQENALLEGVSDRVKVQNEDVRQLPFEDESFEIIISGLTMHHISHGRDTGRAMGEMIRVLKPGGWLAIYDIPFAIRSSAKRMRENGLKIERIESDLVFGIKP